MTYHFWGQWKKLQRLIRRKTLKSLCKMKNDPDTVYYYHYFGFYIDFMLNPIS